MPVPQGLSCWSDEVTEPQGNEATKRRKGRGPCRTADRTGVTRLGAILLIGVLPCPCFGQSHPAQGYGVRIVRIDGTAQEGVWLGADAESIALRLNGSPTQIARDDLMRVSFHLEPADSRPAALTPGDAICTLAGGGRVRGRLLTDGEGSVRLRTAALGELSLRFADLAAIRLGWAPENPRADAELAKWLAVRSPGNDILIAVPDGNVTVVRGALLALGPDGGRFAVEGRALPLRAEVSYAVVFGGGLAASPPPPLTVQLQDGSEVAASLDRADTERISLRLPGGATASVSISQIRQMIVRSGRIAYASDLTPSDVRFEPFLDTPWPHRRDRSVANRPLRLGGIEYAKGLGVHSRSEIAFDVERRYRQFAATIGIDDAVRPRGNVVFRILADDREVFHSGPVTGRDEPRPILVDVAKARRVRLIVEYGEELDLADQADWADARFIR